MLPKHPDSPETSPRVPDLAPGAAATRSPPGRTATASSLTRTDHDGQRPPEPPRGHRHALWATISDILHAIDSEEGPAKCTAEDLADYSAVRSDELLRTARAAGTSVC